jgi:adenylyltransferase/sulfurtransferase
MSNPNAEPFGRLTPQEAKKRLDSGELKLVDVREGWEFQRDHIPGASHLPLGQIIARPAEVLKESDVVFVCEVGQRSGVAAEMAAALGLTNVNNLDGGMQAWRGAGLPIEA